MSAHRSKLSSQDIPSYLQSTALPQNPHQAQTHRPKMIGISIQIVQSTLLRKMTAEFKMHVKLRWNGKKKNSYFFGSEDYSEFN
jgi:hypothetical protein